MKLTYFRLKGYINILNGMGIDELIIPFNTFKNRIILISGQNGTGKSTIIQACSPTPDSADSFRTDVFIDNYGNRQIVEWPAEKELIYDDNGTIYHILIQSLVDDSRTKRTTKAFISRDGEELNPNGNVNSFKEIRDSVLGIDPVYLDLSSISSEHRGIVDMIPSDRRRYMSSYIGSLDTYNNIFKVISKKASSLKSYMNTINSKLYELGNEDELRLNQIQLEMKLKSLNEARDKAIKELSEAETTVKIIDPDNKIQDLYQSILDSLTDINARIKQNEILLVSLQGKLNKFAQIDDLDKELLDKQKLLEDYKSQNESNKSEIDKLTSINEVLSKSIESDRNTLAGLSAKKVQDNIESAVEETRNKVLEYKSYITKDDIEVLSKFTIEELEDLKTTLFTFNQNILTIEEEFNENDFVYALMNMNTKFDKVITKLNKSKNELEVRIAILKNKIAEMQSNLKELDEFNSIRPSNCVDDKCPYIAKFISIRDTTNEDLLNDLEISLSDLENQLSNTDKELERSNNVCSIISKVNTEINILYGSRSSISKIKSLDFLLDIESLKLRLSNHNRFYEFDILNDLIEKKSIYEDLLASEKDLSLLEVDLNIYLANKSIVEKLNSSIEKSEEEYNSNNDKIKSLMKDNIFLDGIINTTIVDISNIMALIDARNKKEELLHEKELLKEQFESVKDKIRTVKEKVDSVNRLKDELNNYDEGIKPLSESINRIKFTLTNIVEYQEEYKDTADKYDKISFIRNCCSPSNGMGIQSEYIKRYMSDIIIDCNKMLGYMFNGAIQLDVPIINEKSFLLPFISVGGMQVPDISNGSTAQKCMIGLVFSCVAMMKSSTKYNIPRLDEIDGGLDQGNRITFIQVLNNILDIMHSDQCIICSHNSEFDTYSTTRIICNPGGIKIEQ